jgi:energy-dependent translational throttle protein EttA
VDNGDFQGETVLSPGHTIGFLEQEPLANETRTVREIVEEGAAEAVALLKEFEEINSRFAEPMEPEEMDALITRQGEVQEKLDAAEAWDLESQLEMAMDALRCPPPDMPLNIVSGGERRRVALCRLLLQKPDILLLDEPTNHLDAESVAWLEHHLQQYPGTIIAVTHDRYFLDNVAGWILELDRGHGIPWKGNYSSWLDQKTGAAASGGEGRIRTPEDPGTGVGVDQDVAASPACQEQGPHRGVRAAPLAGFGKAGPRSWRSSSRRGRAWAKGHRDH